MSSTNVSNLKSNILFIVGPTASGKSALAMEVARRFNGEIICADSQTVRRGLDIGTAKPTESEQAEIRHHLLDVVDPFARFTVADFQREAETAIADIQKRGKLPIVVGGTGLYIDAVAYGFKLRADADLEKRKELEKMSVADLQNLITKNKLAMPKNEQNPRHLIRIIETGGEVSEKATLRGGAILIGVDPGPEALEGKIKSRIQHMIEIGFLNEVEHIIETYGMPPKVFDAIGYNIALNNRTKSGQYNTQKIIDEFIIGDRQYAKRQRSWFKRNRDIVWFEQPEKAQEYLKKILE
jgi:tRNA dimethylallyltransferase